MNRLREVGGEGDLLDHRALRHLQKKGVFLAPGIHTTSMTDARCFLSVRRDEKHCAGGQD